MIGLLVIPGAYLTLSRLKSWPERISWILINPALIFYLCYGFTDNSLLSTAFIFLLTFMSWQSAYEVGYLVNDFITVRTESAPNIRVRGEIGQEIEARFWALIAAKAFVSVFLLLACWFYLRENALVFRFNVLLCGVVLSQVFFFAHNTIRSRANIITYFCLCMTKYLTLPLSFYFGSRFLLFIVGVFLIFPLLRVFEHASKPKYDIKTISALYRQLGKARALYYVFIFFLFASLVIFKPYMEFKVFFFASGFMFLYRFLVWLRYDFPLR